MVLRNKIDALNFCREGARNLLLIFVSCSQRFFPDAERVLYGNNCYFPVLYPTDLYIQLTKSDIAVEVLLNIQQERGCKCITLWRVRVQTVTMVKR